MSHLSHQFNDKTISLILGGGAGTRLYPLTKDRSKPAVPIAGKYRLIDIPISNCINSGLRKIYVLTQFNSASLNKHISNSYRFDLFSDGYVDILAAEQTRSNSKWFQGTADAVRQALPNTKNRNAEYIIILSGDQLYQMDLSIMLSDHIKNEADITIATIPVSDQRASAFGIMKVNASNEINAFIEKPPKEELPKWKSVMDKKFADSGKDYLASMGIYIFSKKVMVDLLHNVYPDATDFGKEIIPSSIKKGMAVYSYPFRDYWSDIGDIPSFFEANIELSKPDPEFNLFKRNSTIYTRSRQLAPTKLHNVVLKNAFLAEGSVIKADLIENCIIGVRSDIGEGSILQNCYIMGNDRYEYSIDRKENIKMGIGKNAHIKNAIIDKHVRIGDNVHIIGDESLEDGEFDNYSIRQGIIVMNKWAKVSHGAKIGKTN